MPKAAAEFHMAGNDFAITPEVTKAFNQCGYIIVRNLLDSEEVQRLKSAFEGDVSISKYTYSRDDGQGKESKLALWRHPGDDISGMVARSDKVAGTFEQLLNGEVYQYYAKLMQKEAKIGGGIVWHQDYAYWYTHGCLRPDMGTVFIALDKATRQNGCLQIIEGSNLLGRLDSLPVGEMFNTDPQRLQDILEHTSLQRLHVEMEPGDAVFFHGNTLHRSDQNLSEDRRWAYVLSYNRANNNPIQRRHQAQYTPLTKVPNSAIMRCDPALTDEGKDYFMGTSSSADVSAFK